MWETSECDVCGVQQGHSSSHFGFGHEEEEEFSFDPIDLLKRRISDLEKRRNDLDFTFGEELALEKALSDLQNARSERFKILKDKAFEDDQDLTWAELCVKMEELIELATSLATEDEVCPPMCIETLDDPHIQHVCEEKEEEWVTSTVEAVKEDEKRAAESTKPPFVEHESCQALGLLLFHSIHDHRPSTPPPTRKKKKAKKKSQHWGLVVSNPFFESVMGIQLLRRRDPGSLVIPRVKTHKVGKNV